MGETAENKKSKFSLKKVLKNLDVEFHKIIWPTKDSLIKQTIAVILVSIILGALIFGVDSLSMFVLERFIVPVA